MLRCAPCYYTDQKPCRCASKTSKAFQCSTIDVFGALPEYGGNTGPAVLNEFYRHYYPADGEVVTELRALRAAYEYTGGCNPALCVSLDRTLGEALKVDAARRLWGSHSRVNEFDRRYWDFPYYSVPDAALNTTHRARDLERINRESDRIRDELESLRATQEERARQYARMNPP
ncbi:nAchR subunit [Clonorchis sinensis]|uniref:NAchR subunit n=1 Tax=Clonorchis sinensis TaxID=79923 RepID=G7Y6C6_CLOSI|nr:nAchR subunit [Clonorchis sinensis]